jgi:two-component system sensor histidine kinase UhpB
MSLLAGEPTTTVQAGDTIRVRRSSTPRYRPLGWRIFALNAAVLAVSGLIAMLVLWPRSQREPVALDELAVLAAAILVMLILNRWLLFRAVAPLQGVVGAMRETDGLTPSHPLAVPEGPSEAHDLAIAFNDMNARLEAERQDSSRRALGAQEAERERIARELHDEVGQQLTALLLQLSSAGRRADPELQPALTEAHELARTTLEDVRRVARELRPEALDDLGLASALAALAERLHKQAGLRVDLRLPRELPPLTEEQELAIYRIAQEALTNVIRHADHDRAELTLQVDEEAVVLDVRDEGLGFDPDAMEATGLRGMRERSLLVGARLGVHSRLGHGTLVRLALPLRRGR